MGGEWSTWDPKIQQNVICQILYAECQKDTNKEFYFIYCMMHQSVTFDLLFAVGIKPSDITFFHDDCPKALNVWLISLCCIAIELIL